MKTDLSQDAAFAIKGHWWIPGSNTKIAGELVYSGEDLTLSLLGGLSRVVNDNSMRSTPLNDAIAIAHGETLDGCPVTLVDLFHKKWMRDDRELFPAPGTTTSLRYSDLHCAAAIVGEQISSRDHRFCCSTIDIPGLETWIGEDPFTLKIDTAAQPVVLSYKQPEQKSFKIRTETISFVTKCKLPSSPSHSPSFCHSAHIQINSDGGHTFTEFLQLAADLSQFFSMCYGYPVQTSSIRICSDPPSRNDAMLFVSRHQLAPKGISPSEICVRFADVAPFLALILEKWIWPSQSNLRARRMLVSSESQPSRFSNLRFLPLMQALEVLSNEAPGSCFMNKGEFRQILREFRAFFSDKVEPAMMNAISGNLGHVNCRSLKNRIRLMIDGMQESTWKLFCVDPETFVNAIVETRNHLTHYSCEPGGLILQDLELHWAIRKLSVMLRVLLLLNAGIPEDVLRNAFQLNVRWMEERRVWSNVSESGTPLQAL